MQWYHMLNNSIKTGGNWETHQGAVRTLVQQALSQIPSRNTALILGAGNCRDIPLEILTNEFQLVILADADDTTIRHVAATGKNMLAIPCDLSGLHQWMATLPHLEATTASERQDIEEAWKTRAIPPIPAEHPLTPWIGQCDLVLSIGVATQLIFPALVFHTGNHQIAEQPPWPNIIVETARSHRKLAQDLLQPQGIGVFSTEIMTSENVTARLPRFVELVSDNTLTLPESLMPFPEASLHVGVTECPREAPGFSRGEESGLPPSGGNGFLLIVPSSVAL